MTDQGTVFSSCDDPTPEDLAYAEVGMVTIVRLSDLCSYGAEHRWVPVPPSELSTVKIEAEDTLPVHAVRERTCGV